MENVYLIIVIVLFFLAVSDLIVGVSNDAVNFLNSAVGSKTASLKVILAVAALGIVVGCTFSSGMMEVARKGIFNPEHFYFSEIILLFLAVMVTDIILLDTFNSFGMPTSTTVSIVFELLGAATAFTIIKIYSVTDALTVGEYINSGKALAIISGILLSVVVAFTVGVIFQYITRLIFSFNYKNSLKYVGAIWGGFAISAITYFMLIKGVKGASFMSKETQAAVTENTVVILLGSFVVWTVILYLLTFLTKVNILKFIVLIGTFSLAWAFAGNDLVNFIGVPLAGYNSYEIYIASGAGADSLLMSDLAGKVPTPTLLLLAAGIIMAITLWKSSKARSVIKTSLDLGRQHGGYERFNSYAASRSIVRNFSKMANFVNNKLPESVKNGVNNRFDQRPFTEKQVKLGKEAPSFDMVRAATTLVCASILISIGTIYKLPLSTTYVTFMVFMGTSLADGAWGRESAVYRVSGVLSVVGGWFFTAFSAFTGAFILANILYFGGVYALVPVVLGTGFIIYRTHKYHGEKVKKLSELEQNIINGNETIDEILGISTRGLENILTEQIAIIEEALDGLEQESLSKLNKAHKRLLELNYRTWGVKESVNDVLNNINDEDLEIAQFYVLAADYLYEMTLHVSQIVKPSLSHVDNSHKPLIPIQIQELRAVNQALKFRMEEMINVFTDPNRNPPSDHLLIMKDFSTKLRVTRKKQIKRIKNHEIGTRNSQLFLSLLGEFRNLALYSIRLLKVYKELVLDGSLDTQDEKSESIDEN